MLRQKIREFFNVCDSRLIREGHDRRDFLTAGAIGVAAAGAAETTSELWRSS